MKYAWGTYYVPALSRAIEVMHTSFYEAIAAMEQRRVNPISTAENITLVGAEAEIQILIAEMTAKYDEKQRSDASRNLIRTEAQ